MKEEEDTMRALRAYSTSASPVLDEVAPPELGPTDVQIRVAAAAVNPVDVGVLTGPVRGLTGLPDPVGLGWDVSGTVSEVGGEVSGLQPGDRVAGILHVIALKPGVGAHADETVLPADAVALVPDGLDLVEAASLPLNALTARQALDLFGPAEGRTLLVTGGAGAVGGHAIPLAVRAGWRVTALARDADADFVVRAGAEPVAELPGPSFDAVLDAAVLLESALAVVRDGGVFVGVAPGSPVAAERGIAVHTVSVEPDSEAIAGLLGLAAEGTLEVRVAGRVPLRDAAKAFEKVAGGGQRGRWLLIP
jgi:NADPH:quinone reductase-like Zn-dependent oxidoreductase